MIEVQVASMRVQVLVHTMDTGVSAACNMSFGALILVFLPSDAAKFA